MLVIRANPYKMGFGESSMGELLQHTKPTVKTTTVTAKIITTTTTATTTTVTKVFDS